MNALMGIEICEQGMTVIAPDHSSAFWLHNCLARSHCVYEAVSLPENGRIEFRAAGTRDFDCLKGTAINGYYKKSYAPA